MRTLRSPFCRCGDGPAVAVLDPVGGGEAESAVVAAGDDHVSDTGPFPSAKALRIRQACDRDDARGHGVEFGDEVPGGGDHDRVEPSRSVGNPSVERILRRGG